jgi:hypothetical protein
MSLVWKLLRQHISIPQFIGFFFANLFGMLIVLLGFQLYHDVMPVFTAEDSFMKSDYLILSKRVGTASTISGRTNSFSNAEVDELGRQKFVAKVGAFTSTEYKMDAHMGVNGTNVLNSELFFESIPDEFIDVPLKDWKYTEGSKVVPIILPRTYIAMYNFGFARSHSLPKLSEGLMGMIDFQIFIHGNGHQDEFTGKVIGFSSRLNTILVPQSFMDWSNGYYAPDSHSDPTRLVLKTAPGAGEQLTRYVDKKGYEVEDDKLQAEKTTYFLQLMVTIVVTVGLIISVLSFYILMLSIYLLVQKNSTKLENLLLIGYGPDDVARPYQLLTVGLNIGVLIIALIVLLVARTYYLGILETLFPELDTPTMWPAVGLGLVLFIVVSICNIVAIRHKIIKIWKRKE